MQIVAVVAAALTNSWLDVGAFVAAPVSEFAHGAGASEEVCMSDAHEPTPTGVLNRRAPSGSQLTALLPLADADAAFQASYPDYATTHHLDDLRASDYARLDRAAQVYVDYTGGGLYAESQVRTHMDLLRDSVLGNPHSTNPTSLAMTQLVEQARAYRAAVLPRLRG